MNLEETYSSTVDPFLPAFIMSERSPIGPSIFPPPGSRIETYGYVVALTIIVYDMSLLSRKESTFTRMINTGSAVPGSFLIVISKAWSRFKLMYICTRVFALMEFSFCLYLIQQSVPGQTHPLSGKYIYRCDTAISEAAGIVPRRLERYSFCILIGVPSKLITIHQVSAFLIPVISIEVVNSLVPGAHIATRQGYRICFVWAPGSSALPHTGRRRRFHSPEAQVYEKVDTSPLCILPRWYFILNPNIHLEYHGFAEWNERRKYGDIIHVAFTCILHLRITNHLEPTDSRP
ncbi:hypothetical protein NP233_g10046 [Leucocoprinus birnbaumii]|uniref:Uncharacterized protein n=1 Tax=Leucocoprinus birnbaumii TaxID=56174 RepID=A0AAD5YLN9_9AGAR|nr:hypothetical protein NP233_g10046 [Leucocoprinus birnbaumii]